MMIGLAGQGLSGTRNGTRSDHGPVIRLGFTAVATAFDRCVEMCVFLQKFWGVYSMGNFRSFPGRSALAWPHALSTVYLGFARLSPPNPLAFTRLWSGFTRCPPAREP